MQNEPPGIDAPEDRVSLAQSFFIAGRAYVTGAHAIVKSDMRRRFENDVRFIIPCMMLVAHAVEVYLKAWLSATDPARFTETELKRRFGHDLTSLYEEARATGLPEPQVLPQQTFFDLVESYGPDHAAFNYRYPKDGWGTEVPKNDVLFAILTRLDREIAAKVGGSIPDNLDWSVSSDEDFRSSTPDAVLPKRP
jgi:hypothetical protein